MLMLGLVVACAAAAGVVIGLSASGSDQGGTVDDPQAVATPPAPYVVFRNLDRSDATDYGRVAVAPLDDLGARTLAGVACERVDFSGVNGLCIEIADRFPLRYKATILDEDLRPVRSYRVPGLPSRARVSSDGRWGATTTFVSGHSYADIGVFSTRAMIVDMATGRTVIDNLEDLPVTRDGAPMESVDHNFWGITFAPDDETFYATLSTGGETYLVRGTVGGRRLEVLHENVECPSASPDGTRIAYKKRVGASGLWHLTVLDLATMTETPLAEDDPIDDQVEWLDDDTIIYRDGEAVHAVPADGSGAAERLLPGADSPSVVRPAV
jgi:hypothetical protein